MGVAFVVCVRVAVLKFDASTNVDTILILTGLHATRSYVVVKVKF